MSWPSITHGTRGARRSRAPRGRSVEGEPLALSRGLAIAPPLAEYRFHPTRDWRFDFAWPDAMLALEVEGGVFQKGGGRHNRPTGFLADVEKYNEAAVLGWRVLRCAPGTRTQFSLAAGFAAIAAAMQTTGAMRQGTR